MASAWPTWTPTAAGRAPGCCRRRTSTRWSRRFTSAAAARAGWRAARPPPTWTRTRSTARSTTRSAAATANISMARAIQCFVPGIPQIYYVGLLAGGNDLDLLRRTGVGRDINRHYYTADGAARAARRGRSCGRCSRCCGFATRHPAFDGTFQLDARRQPTSWCSSGRTATSSPGWTST